MNARPPTPDERQAVQALLSGPLGPPDLDAPTIHPHVVTDDSGSPAAASIWLEPRIGPPIFAAALANPNRLDHLYALAKAAALDMLKHGFSTGRFTVDSAALRALQRDFTIDPHPSAWHPQSAQPVMWTVDVDLQDAIAQLLAWERNRA